MGPVNYLMQDINTWLADNEHKVKTYEILQSSNNAGATIITIFYREIK